VCETVRQVLNKNAIELGSSRLQSVGIDKETPSSRNDRDETSHNCGWIYTKMQISDTRIREELNYLSNEMGGRDSPVGIPTCYELDGSSSIPGTDTIFLFSTVSGLTLGPT
jgi:hypothetical protein